jgi:hypothetical protein
MTTGQPRDPADGLLSPTPHKLEVGAPEGFLFDAKIDPDPKADWSRDRSNASCGIVR